MTYQVFIGSEAARRRYWARSMAGWPLMAAARPNDVHAALGALEARGRMSVLVTQNVDGLHQRAGSREVIDLHGRLDRVVCLACGTRSDRAVFQDRLDAANPGWSARVDASTPLALRAIPQGGSEPAFGRPRGGFIAPDGDADIEGMDFGSFRVPACEVCGGVLKPDVVFYGEAVPRARVQAATAALAGSDALLVVGSSLMVFSSFRLAKQARELGLPVAAVNLGQTRADDFLQLKVARPAAEALTFLMPRPDRSTAAVPAQAGSNPAATSRTVRRGRAGPIPAG